LERAWREKIENAWREYGLNERAVRLPAIYRQRLESEGMRAPENGKGRKKKTRRKKK
jgi:hypothetical protein